MNPTREPLPTRRKGYTQKLKIGGHTFYLKTDEYPDGRLGSIFIDCAKEGAMLRSVAHVFAIAVSTGLQHGVPLERFADAFVGTAFEPAGAVKHHPQLKECQSFIDAIFKDLAISYLGRSDLAHKTEPGGDESDSDGGGDVPADRPGPAPVAPPAAALQTA